MKRRCDDCPKFAAQTADVADFARRVKIADTRADELLADSGIIATAMSAAVDSFERPELGLGDNLTPDEELYAMTVDGPIPTSQEQGQQLAGALWASIPVLKARRHETLDTKIEELDRTRHFCDALGSCGLELLSFDEE